jgi:hypothetical protein
MLCVWVRNINIMHVMVQLYRLTCVFVCVDMMVLSHTTFSPLVNVKTHHCVYVVVSMCAVNM